MILKAEIMDLGDNPRFVVTSLNEAAPESLYRDLYCARGQDENYIKMIKNACPSRVHQSVRPEDGLRSPVAKASTNNGNTRRAGAKSDLEPRLT